MLDFAKVDTSKMTDSQKEEREISLTYEGNAYYLECKHEVDAAKEKVRLAQEELKKAEDKLTYYLAWRNANDPYA